MANRPSPFVFSSLLMLLSLALASSPDKKFPHPQCHEDEASALLQFKQSLTIDMCAFPFDYPKLESWRMLLGGQRRNCCSWAGVECDNTTGHVISLDLSGSCLYGSLISFNTTLPKLPKLEYLNLAYNNFRRSSIPSMSGLFPQLAYLNLSYSVLSGFVPPSVSHLSKLSVLDLDYNDGLILEGHAFEAVVENLTRLERLHLSYVDISSTIPKMMVNLSSLSSLSLPGCGLLGRFPAAVFNLDNLQMIYLDGNRDLVGVLPDQFNSSSPLEYLLLYDTGFSGLLPVSIGNLHSLEALSVGRSVFSGQLPNSLRNLTQLSSLDISYNNFEISNPSSLSWIGKLTKLNFLGLNSISLPGDIPAYLSNLTQLSYMNLQNCQLTGPIPSWLSKMSMLYYLELGFNKLQGPIDPSLFSQLTELSFLDLSYNNMSGKVDIQMFLDLEMLTSFFLSENNLSLVHGGNRVAIAGRFSQVGLGSCNLQHFPYFLHNQDQLTWLELSNNNISGRIPTWIWNVTRDTLELINLSYNFLTGFESDPALFPWPRATWIQLQNNMFHGPLPVPPASTISFLVSKNNFTGGISPKFCSLKSLSSLDLSDNYLRGEVPQCLANLASLKILVLGGNNFNGSIPRPSMKHCNLEAITLEDNKFNGTIPRSISNCPRLEFLNFGNNQIRDTFPSWLGSLKQLRILILRSNNLYGELAGDEVHDQFPKLRIIDISWNNLSGPPFPTGYFIGWNAMKVKEDIGTYLGSDRSYRSGSIGEVSSYYIYSMMMTNKGLETTYQKIMETFVAIEFSGNRFNGDLPVSIGSMVGLRLLNLSNNILTGSIPSSLSNLSNLEALDLSGNNLSGEIPPELTRLTFLSFFNASNNNLTGTIPKGNQFDIFQNDSYLGNPALCGKPLSKQCGDTPQPPPSTSDDDDEDSLFDFGWEPVAIGYGCGFPLGIGLGYLVYTRKYIWIVKIFGEKRRWRRNVVRGVGQWDGTR